MYVLLRPVNSFCMHQLVQIVVSSSRFLLVAVKKGFTHRFMYEPLFTKNCWCECRGEGERET